MKAVLSNRIYLTKTPELMKVLEAELYYAFPNNSPNPKARPITYYDVTTINDNVISIPIARQDLIPDNYAIIDKRTSIPALHPDADFSLYPEQVDVFNLANDSCVINAKPGWGKTYTALAILQKLSQKTLIVTHKVDLRDQWESEIFKVFKVRPSVIGSGAFDISKDIVVANTQTLIKYKEELSRSFGLIIVDEVHRLPSASFKGVVDSMSAKYKIGLSGTLIRKDKKHPLIFDYISKDVIVAKNTKTMIPTVTAINSNIELMFKRTEPWATTINNLVGDPRYIQLVCDIAQSAAIGGHTVLVVSDRVEFLETCSFIVDNAALLVGESSDKADIIKGVGDGSISVLFASSSIFAEGMNIPKLSALVLAVNISDNHSLLEQIIGRVTRLVVGKRTPVVFDLALKGYTGQKQFQSRLNYYINSGFKVDIIDALL